MNQVTPRTGSVKVFPPPPEGFDATTASITDLVRHGLPPRPNAETDPVSAAQWDHIARRYGKFEHVKPELVHPDTSATVATEEPLAGPFGLDHFESCGYELFSPTAPFTSLAATWTVPDLNFKPSAFGPNQFHTFLGLGFLDVHVEMTVDSAQNVTAAIAIHTGAQVTLPVRPGDVISAVLCAPNEPEGPNQSPSGYFLANETTLQSANFQVVTGFPPAVRINAGISRTFDHPNKPLARFGAVYFDDILAVTANGSPSLTDDGVATTMISFPDPPGTTLARPVKLNQSAFKIVYEGD
jgi:Peptidase A4 family